MSVEPGLSVPFDRSAVPPTDVPAPRRQRRRAPRPVPAEPTDRPTDHQPLPPLIAKRPPRPRRKGRRVRRVVRRVELWSVLKVSLVFNTVMLGMALAAVALLWGLANTTGLLDDVEGFLRDSGFEDFRFEGDRMFRQVAFVGAVLTLAFTVFTVLAVALFNLISEMTGGVRFVVIEEIVPVTPRPRVPPVLPPVATAVPERVPAEPVKGMATPPPGFGRPAPLAAGPTLPTSSDPAHHPDRVGFADAVPSGSDPAHHPDRVGFADAVPSGSDPAHHPDRVGFADAVPSGSDPAHHPDRVGFADAVPSGSDPTHHPDRVGPGGAPAARRGRVARRRVPGDNGHGSRPGPTRSGDDSKAAPTA